MLVVNNMVRDKKGLDREDHELVAHARKGNRQAYQVLVERYQHKAMAVAMDIMRSREDAEDVVQDALVKAYVALKQFKGEAKFSTWLYRIVYTTAIDARRRLARRGGDTREYDERQETEGQSALFANRFSSPAAAAEQRQELGFVRTALSELSEEHRQVVVLREIDGMAYDEIANVVGVSKGTVMSRLFYARKKLQQRLKQLATTGGQSVEEPRAEKSAQ